MLHITRKAENSHKKIFTVEIVMSLMLLTVFSSNFAQASDITADMVIKLTNKARESAKIATLKKNDLLTEAAKKKAEDMVDNNYFAHFSPKGTSPWELIEDAGYDYRFAGENLAINFTNSEDEQKAWMDSPLHRKNILNPDYEEIGVAVKKGVIDGHQTIVTVQEFGTRIAEKAEVASVSVSDDAQTKKAVAGAVPANKIEKMQKEPVTINNAVIFSDNKQTLFGWLIIFGIALAVFVIDVAAVFHKKHRQLLILHDARK